MAKDSKKVTIKIKAGKPVGTGKTCLPYDRDPSIGGDSDAKKPNKKLEMSLFGADALESQIATTPDYAAKSKKGFYNDSAWKHIEENEISPTADY